MTKNPNEPGSALDNFLLVLVLVEIGKAARESSEEREAKSALRLLWRGAAPKFRQQVVDEIERHCKSLATPEAQVPEVVSAVLLAIGMSPPSR